MKSTKNCAKNVRTGALFLSGIAAFAIQVPPASAVDYGLGAAHQGQGNTVMVPIKTQSMLIEPEVLLNNLSQSNFHSRVVNPGVGVYMRRELGSLFESYMGGRFVHESSKSEFAGNTFKSTAYTLGPTFGIQHFFSKQFSLGLDASLVYRTGKQTQTGQPDLHFHSWDTRTRVLLRAFF
jgi:hypothetical protein